MKVVTFDIGRVDEASVKLANRVLDSGFMPDIVVGIRNGGLYIGQAVTRQLSSAGCNVVFMEASAGRKSTGWKKRFLSRILPQLPVSVLDWLRIVESRMLQRSKPEVVGDFSISGHASDLSRHKVLVVDDAVDSGATMKKVVDMLQTCGVGRSDIMTAVITVTTADPLLSPDFYIFNDETLIRFPWSIDAKKI